MFVNIILIKLRTMSAFFKSKRKSRTFRKSSKDNSNAFEVPIKAFDDFLNNEREFHIFNEPLSVNT